MKSKIFQIKLDNSYIAENITESGNASLPWLEIVAIVIALLALAVSIYTGYLQRKHNRLSVSPRINLIPAFQKDSLSLSLENSGVGPAIVTKIKFSSVADKDYTTEDAREFFQKVFREVHEKYGDLLQGTNLSGGNHWHSHDPIHTYSLKEGAKLELFKLVYDEFKPNQHFYEALQTIIKNYQITIKFESVYEEEFGHTMSIL